MRITVLMENTASRPDLAAEHGLSLYVETEKHRILFDAGQSEAFAENAQKLGVDLAAVDLAVLSHGHYDHGGGMLRFLQENDHAPLYVHRAAFQPHWHGPDRYIGLPPALKDNSRVIPVADEHIIDDELTLCTCSAMPMAWPPSFGGLQVMRGGQLAPDDFLHEQYLVVKEGDKRVVISGCSHKGAMNVLTWLRPEVFIGGFHFVKMDPLGEQLQASIKAMAAFPCRYLTGHCTGQAQYDALKDTLGERIGYLSTGMSIEV